jgi:hypothetical protein
VITPDFNTNSSAKKEKEKVSIKGSYRYNFHGLLLPFEQNGGDDLNPYIMLKILPELN